MTDSSINRIVLSFEHPDLESFGRQFCDGFAPDAEVMVRTLELFLDQIQQPPVANQLDVLVLHADNNGEPHVGSPGIQKVMAARRPVLIIRKSAVQELAISRFNRVVVPLDGSSVAGQAISIASQIASARALPVKFVMVIDPNRLIPPAFAYDPEAWGVIEALRTTAHWALGQAEAKMHSDGVQASSDLLLGSINASLKASFRTDDLVVMTTHGPDHSEKRRGSLAQLVLEATCQPILIMQGQPQVPVVVDAYQDDNWVSSVKTPTARIA